MAICCYCRCFIDADTVDKFSHGISYSLHRSEITKTLKSIQRYVYKWHSVRNIKA
jgi:hypothetical protein